MRQQWLGLKGKVHVQGMHLWFCLVMQSAPPDCARGLWSGSTSASSAVPSLSTISSDMSASLFAAAPLGDAALKASPACSPISRGLLSDCCSGSSGNS
eukprot:UN17001